MAKPFVQYTIRIAPELDDTIVKLTNTFNVSVNQLINDGLRYALDNLETVNCETGVSWCDYEPR